MLPRRARLFRICCLIVLACGGNALAQSALVVEAGSEAPAYQPVTGDAWIDRHLRDIDVYATRYPDSFVDEVSRYGEVPRDYVQALLDEQHWQAGDIYFACMLAKATAQPCRALVRAWAQASEAGWKDVLAGLQPPAGKRELRAVRASIEASYTHWARPLPD
ncbi:hypothetical protein CSC70_05965 [Pseudoxanthomonas kalamensis DSM 18571]|uniref:hypothetical protein n=1 Tax=Pseudoxanthomonas kalamensis TaxID=289483 RepID=UPI001390C81E|nr:hypothetical protein [Pseudoxanthomonas kalamensis]KAF1711446.1 hypothetical protein CSC70_05965 [Pseudoxanthomonas kalamensis DSM 18571]